MPELKPLTAEQVRERTKAKCEAIIDDADENYAAADSVDDAPTADCLRVLSELTVQLAELVVTLSNQVYRLDVQQREGGAA